MPAPARIAVFDNDGTLWCEKPHAGRARVHPAAAGGAWPRAIPSLRDRQPWKAAYEKDYAWLGGVVTKHYHGDDSDVKVLDRRAS